MGFWVDPFYPKTVSNGNSIHGSKPVRHRAQTNFPGYINTYLKITWQAKFAKSHKKGILLKGSLFKNRTNRQTVFQN